VSASIDKAVANAEWWLPVPNATWRTPEGVYLVCLIWWTIYKFDGGQIWMRSESHLIW
jgi:hypothetical protein